MAAGLLIILYIEGLVAALQLGSSVTLEMAFILDLEPCSYFPVPGAPLVAVGWLGRGEGFARGTVSESFFAKLSALCASPCQPIVAAGYHTCELCQYEPPRFSANVFVPHAGRIYVAPVGIRHYVAAHRYLPPAEFIEAVLACPDMKSRGYKQALLANGGRSLVHLSTA